MFRFFVLFLFLLLAGCQSIVIPDNFEYKEIVTDTFTIASWQKISDNKGTVKVYIEGDGASFDSYGRPTKDPTPRGKMIRELAFGDYSSNVVYLARPCQFVMSDICSVRHWTSARFSYEIVNATYQAVKQIAGKRDVVLVGFSGGAQVAGLVSVLNRDLNIKKVISVAGNLDHLEWTEYHNLPSLNESLNLADYKSLYFDIQQKHYVGDLDNVIPSGLVFDFVKDKNIDVEIVKRASHSEGWNAVYGEIWKEK